MKYPKLGPLVSLIAFFLVSMPGGFAQNESANQIAPPLRLTVAPTASSMVTMKTLPNAVCTLHAEGATDAKHSLKVFADDEGTIRFHVNPTAESEQAARVAVDCAAAGKTSTFPLELRPNSKPTSDMPAPAAELAKPRAGAVIRPALSKADALSLSTEELIQIGYPVRPDAQKAPKAFATWL